MANMDVPHDQKRGFSASLGYGLLLLVAMIGYVAGIGALDEMSVGGVRQLGASLTGEHPQYNATDLYLSAAVVGTLLVLVAAIRHHAFTRLVTNFGLALLVATIVYMTVRSGGLFRDLAEISVHALLALTLVMLFHRAVSIFGAGRPTGQRIAIGLLAGTVLFMPMLAFYLYHLPNHPWPAIRGSLPVLLAIGAAAAHAAFLAGSKTAPALAGIAALVAAFLYLFAPPLYPWLAGNATFFAPFFYAFLTFYLYGWIFDARLATGASRGQAHLAALGLAAVFAALPALLLLALLAAFLRKWDEVQVLPIIGFKV